MIYSSLRLDKKDWKPYPDSFLKGFEWLKNTDLSEKEPGCYAIEDDDIYALVQKIETVPAANKRPEAHKEYVDIQYIISGEEKMGFASDTQGLVPVDGNEENDIYFYKNVENENFVVCHGGDFCVFFPYDIHRPGCCVNEPSTVRKVVVKVRVNTI